MPTRPRNRDFRRFTRRVWLNRVNHHSTASFLAKIQHSFYHSPARSSSALETQCVITDCYHRVDLDFDCCLMVSDGRIDPHSLGELANTEYKATMLKKQVSDFCDTVLAATHDMRDWAAIEARRQSELAEES